MSIKAMHWAWHQQLGSTTAKLVLMKLADIADDFCEGHPSIELIARQCEINERTVQRTIRLLETSGHLRVEQRFHRGRHISNAYHLNVPGARGGNLPPLAPTPPLTPAPVPPQAPAPTPPQTPATMSPLAPARVPDRGDTGVTPTTTASLKTKSTTRHVTSVDGDCDASRIILLASLTPEIRAEAKLGLSKLPQDLAQTVADEWSANIRRGNVRNPMAYLTTLIKVARSGEFRPELAAVERARRESLAVTQR